jgi:hypothetical protein
MLRAFIICGFVTVLAARPALAQGRDTTLPRKTVVPQADAPACCRVVRIDAERSLVTARETATGYTFRFALRNPRGLALLKIGQPVWADFAAKSVKLKATDAAPCCGIVETKEDP